MAKQYDNWNRGALFNDKANKRDDNGRDYSGTINIEGREYCLSGWIKTSSKDGRKISRWRPRRRKLRATPTTMLASELSPNHRARLANHRRTHAARR